MIDVHSSMIPFPSPPEKKFYWQRSGCFLFGSFTLRGKDTQLFEITHNPARNHWKVTRFGLMGWVKDFSSRGEAISFAQESLSSDFKIAPGIKGEE